MLSTLLIAFIGLRILQQLIESALAYLNVQYVSNPTNQTEAKQVLALSGESLEKSLSYTIDRYRFGQFSAWVQLGYTLIFLALGGLGYVERLASSLTHGQPILQGLAVFAILGALSFIAGLPFGYYNTFVIEERHGFNRQTKRGFWLDQVKGIALGAILGGLVIAVLLWIMNHMGSSWWWIAWLAIFGFSLLTAWLYPTLLAPLFNTFSPLDEGDLKVEIFRLAQKIEFQAEGISIMDASTRSSHGNAYFTGVFGKKKIVLFDTLVKSMDLKEIVAVLAHELGHFKLHHVRWGLIRSFFTTGIMFYLLSLCLPLLPFYESFGLAGVSNYGALIVFSMWFGLAGFLIQPIGSLISRRHEFQADAFALQHIEDHNSLGDALLKLRETSHSMPITHPWYSAFYHSHPPLLERLKAMNYIGGR
ncbi:MAG: M48 family metallopeptidase [Chitinophagaceae bacterium]|nr:M48 family metallopeptidase [Oligoflexus sp.]